MNKPRRPPHTAPSSLPQGALPSPPLAIVDFYGPKYFQDAFWTQPLLALSHVPGFDEAFTNKVFSEPLRTSTASSLERKAAEAPRTAGPPKPDLSVPRNAWLFTVLKQGKQLRYMAPDGDVDRIDPVTTFVKGFPPTYFVHGAADEWILPRFSEQAHQKLTELGVESKLALVPDLVHGFDAVLAPEDPRYEHVRDAFAFLKQHAGI